MKNNGVLDLSWDTIFKLGLSIITLYILFQVQDILIWFVFAVIISILFSPGIDFLTRFKLPRVVATSLIYILIFGLLTVALYFMLSVLILEIEEFSRVLPAYFRALSPILMDFGIYALEDIRIFIESIRGSLRELTTALFSASFALFGGILTTFFVMTMAFFISLDGKLMERAVILIFPEKYEGYAFSLWKKSQKQVSGWFLSRVLSCLFVGLAIYISALVMGVGYPFSMGLISGVFNFIPYVGPLISGVFIVLITAMDNLAKAVFILAAFLIIQQIDNWVLTPVLSQKFTGLSPVLVILALAIGGTLWGFLGALLAIPLAGITFDFLKEFIEKRKKIESETV